jgi:hypothetical protein
MCVKHATEILLMLLMKTKQEDLANQIFHLCEITNCTHKSLIEAGLNELLYQLVTKLGNPSEQKQVSNLSYFYLFLISSLLGYASIVEYV